MKKFLAFLIIIIILGGVVFYLGWVQYKIGEDEYGVVFTRTNGWDSTTIEPGVFNWRWEKLIPRNMTIHVFEIKPYTTSLKAVGHLPSGDLYSQYLDGKVDFSYSIEIFYSFKIKAEALPRLASEEDFTPDTMDQWYEDFSESCNELALNYIRNLLKSGEITDRGDIDFIHFEEDFFSHLEKQFDFIEFLTISLKEIRLPDIDLYNAGKDVYFSIIDARETSLAEATIKATFEQVEIAEQLEKLREYGKVLTEYPILLDYFALKNETGTNPLELEDIITLDIVE